MLGPSRLLLIDDDAKSKEALAFAFERHEIAVERATQANAVSQLAKAGELVVVGLDGTSNMDVVKKIHDKNSALPMLVLGDGLVRKDALAAGATQFVERPAFVQDILTLARLLCLPEKGEPPQGRVGKLSDFVSVFYLVRAMAAAKRTAVFTLSRGERRGELHFFEGAVASAKVGSLHSLAALQQLLLWSDADFEFHEESAARPQEIPVLPGDLIRDARRFLEDFEKIARDVTPDAIYEQDAVRVAECVDTIPHKVSPLLRLFDGVRTIADVVEDSTFRVVETIGITRRLINLSAIKLQSSPRPRATSQPALAVSDWFVGAPEPTQGVPMVAAQRDSDVIAVPLAQTGARLSESSASSPRVDWSRIPSVSQSNKQRAAVESPKSKKGEIVAEPGARSEAHKSATAAASPPARFDAMEEAFFSDTQKYDLSKPVDTFDDLDEDLPPPSGFWDRLWGRPATSPGASKRRR